MKCVECGHELKDGAVFCIRCGAMQVSKDGNIEEANNAAVRPSVKGSNANAQHTPSGKSFKPTPRRNPATIAVPIVAAIAAVAAVGALAMFVINPATSGSGSSASAGQVAAASSQSASSASASSSASSASASSSKSSSAASSKSSASSSTNKTSSSDTQSNNNNNGTQQQQQQQPAYTPPEPAYTEPDPADTYYMWDTSDRYYSREEVENLSDYDLYFARNEIFARHGRMFNNSDLQDYFNSKNWYTPTYTPEQWDAMASPLSDIEQQNSALMLEVEQSRNSPYV